MDSAALRDQLEACHQESFSWALNCCGRDRREAEDVLQTTYLKILDGRARFDGRSAFRTWLFAVIRRTAADRWRRRVLQSLRFVPLDAFLDASAGDPGPDERVQGGELRALLERALGRLPRRQREIVLLVFYHGHTIAAAAAVLGIGVGSARTHYARGKARLRALLVAAGWTE
jgi:RNA polymerase sigma-70 factor (ECF subfamily)